MRIIAGQYKGRKLNYFKENIRPSTDRLREALFNILDIRNKTFIDLFAGTGAVGIEAKSRGAQTVVCVENNPEMINIIRQNIQPLKADIHIIYKDVFHFLARDISHYQPDVIFCDPPYQDDILLNLLASFQNIENFPKHGIIVIEFPRKTKVFNDYTGPLRIEDVRVYGQSCLAFITKI